ncbi:MAG: rRNA maturation RNase YbeY [Patescibacteria group bacterium]|nr:rRNA maturation RNase YbeY [Patescibacteria group bacterium]
MRTPSFSLHTTLKSKLPRLPFSRIKDAVAGKNFSVGLVFVGPKKGAALNRTYRGKNYVPNVLSFPLSPSSGEIFIVLSKAVSEAAAYKMKPNDFLIYLFIHALFHLKGYAHGSKMEREERKVLARFGVRRI